MLDTLGNVVTCAVAIIAVIVVPIGIARVWWPEVRRGLGGLRTYLADTFLMSTPMEETQSFADTSAVHVPVPSTDTKTDTTPIGLTTKPTRNEIIITLAMLRGDDNKHLFSANAIYELVKGPRAETMNLIREVREGPAPAVYREYPPQLVTNGHEK